MFRTHQRTKGSDSCIQRAPMQERGADRERTITIKIINKRIR